MGSGFGNAAHPRRELRVFRMHNQSVQGRSQLLRLGIVGVVVMACVALLSTVASMQRYSVHPDTTTTEALLHALRSRNKLFKVLSDDVVYDRYARVYAREIRFPNGKQFSFDIWGRVWKNDSFSVVTVVPFDRATGTFTLVREYNIAHARFVYSFPQGCVERSKHRTNQAAAAAELEEEAQLRCDNWINLLEGDEGVGAPQDKYQRESVFYYLCTDASHVDDPAALDPEENIQIVHGVSSTQLRELVAAGALQSNNIAAAVMGMDKLRQLRLLPMKV